MTRLVDCPACGYGFLRRRSGRCPRCRVRLAMPGEYLADDLDDPGYFYLANGQWMEAGDRTSPEKSGTR